MSPGEPPGITRLMFGWPFNSRVSAGFFRSHVHLQLEINQFFSARKSARDLMNAGGLAGFHGQEFGLHAFGGDHRLDGFGDFVHRQIQAVRHHGHRFGEADVLDGSGGDFFAELIERHARADFLLQRLAPFAGVDDAQSADVIDALRLGGQRDQQLVQYESGIDAGADQRDAPIFCGGVQFCGQLRIGAIRIGQLFARGDHAGFGFQASQQLLHDLGQRRGSGMNDHVGGLSQDVGGIG